MSSRILAAPQRTSSALRCPYCHDRVSPHSSETLTCARCQACHHAACQQEIKTCATCGAACFRRPLGCGLTPRRGHTPRARALQRTLGLVAGLFFLTGVSLMVLGGTVAGGEMFCLGCGLILPALPAFCGWLAVKVTRAALAAEQ